MQERKKTFMAFIDLEKAFDKIQREVVWNILKNRGVNDKIVSLTQEIYKNNINTIVSRNMHSDVFTTRGGLRQGGGLSPLLFIIFMDEVLKKCTTRSKKLNVGYRNLQIVEISEGAFADDVVVMARTAGDLQKNLDLWNKVLEENGMKINKSKTKVIMIGEEWEDLNIEITSGGDEVPEKS